MTTAIRARRTPAPTAETSPVDATPAAAWTARRCPPGPAGVSDVLALQNLRGMPAVSVILSTTPSPRMTPPDLARLNMLLREAERRLTIEVDGTPVQDLLALLRGQAVAAGAGATRSGLALFAGRGADGVDFDNGYQLDVTVHDRVVLSPVYATRDLIRSLHRTPRHLLLLMTSADARLLEGLGDTLTEVCDGFPLHRQSGPDDEAGPPAPQFAQQVDDALGVYLAHNPAPLVVAAPMGMLHSFLRCSSNMQRLAGTLPGQWYGAESEELVEQIRPVLLAYLRNRQLEALAMVTARDRQSRVVTGLQKIWTAARTAPVEMLAVEHDHFAPAKISSNRRTIAAAQDLDAPGVLDDAVDEIIDMVLSRGGWIALVDSGELKNYGHMALTLRRPEKG